MAAPAGPVRYDLTAYHGREIAIEIAIKQADGTTALDLTGGTFLAEIRQGYDADAYLLATLSVVATDEAAGEALVSLPIVDVDALPLGVGIGLWRCLFTPLGATSPYAVFEGAVTVA